MKLNLKISFTVVRRGDLVSRCKTCAAELSRIYYLANVDKMRAASIAWSKRNPEKHRENERRRREANPERHKEKVRRAQLRRKYGISLEQYEEWLGAQSEVCAICKQVDPYGRNLAVDHDHETNEFRGLLCSDCNVGIGNFSDSIELLEAAAQYLKDVMARKKTPRERCFVCGELPCACRNKTFIVKATNQPIGRPRTIGVDEARDVTTFIENLLNAEEVSPSEPTASSVLSPEEVHVVPEDTRDLRP